MVRTILEPLVAASAYANPPVTLLEWVPGDDADGNRFRINGQQMLLARNVTAPAEVNTITGATNATPISINTTGAHGYTTGDIVVISGVQGNLAANGRWTITVVDTDTFTLDTSVGNGVYTSGGVAQISNPLTISIITTTNQYGRTGDIVDYDIEPGETHILARFPITGFRQADGYLYIDNEDPAIEFCVLDLSGQVSSAQ